MSSYRIHTFASGEGQPVPSCDMGGFKDNGEMVGAIGLYNSISPGIWLWSSADEGCHGHAVDVKEFVGYNTNDTVSKYDAINAVSVVDSENFLHVCWPDDDVDGNIHYFNTSNFTREVLYNYNTGNGISMTIDSSDNLYLAFAGENHDVYFMKRTSGSWGSVVTVDTTGDFSETIGDIVIRLDSNDIPQIAWSVGSYGPYGVVYAKATSTAGTNWNARVQLDGGANNYITSIVMSVNQSTDKAYVAWGERDVGFMCATNQSGSWTDPVTIDTENYTSGDISIGSGGRIHFIIDIICSYIYTDNADLSNLTKDEWVFSLGSYPKFFGPTGGTDDYAFMYYSYSGGTGLNIYKGANWTGVSDPGVNFGVGAIDEQDMDTQYPTISDFTVTGLNLTTVEATWDWDGDTANDLTPTFKYYRLYTSEVNQATAEARGSAAAATIDTRSVESQELSVSPGSTLYVAMFPCDIYGNEPPAGTYGDDSRTPPVVSITSLEQTDEVNGYVTITCVISDVNIDECKIRVYYGTTPGTQTNDPTLVGTEVDSTDPAQDPLPDVSNDETYQIGTNEPIEGSATGVTVAFKWDSHTDLGAVNDIYYIKLVGNDGLVDSAAVIDDIAIDSRPDQPSPPTIDNYTYNSITISQTPTTGEPTSTEYAIYIQGGTADNWLGSDGSLTDTEVWQTSDAWASTEISNLTPSTVYILYTKSRYSSSDDLESDNSDTTSQLLPSNPPTVSNFIINTPTDGSKKYTICYDMLDVDSSTVTVSFEYYNGTDYGAILNITGDVGEITGITGVAQTFVATWDAGGDYDDVTLTDTHLKILMDDTTQVITGTSDTFNLDTDNPVMPTDAYLSFASIGTDQMDISWNSNVTEAEQHFETYEIYLSTLSQVEANGRVTSDTCFLWDSNDDANLALTTIDTTTVTGLTHNSTYYCAFFAKDTYGNVSTVIEGSQATLRIYDITGSVLDQNGYGVPNANVFLYTKEDGNFINSTTTDSLGAYSFMVTNDNEHYIIVKKSKYGGGVTDGIFGVGR